MQASVEDGALARCNVNDEQMQVSVEDSPLAQCNVNEEKMQAIVEVGEIATTDLATIQVDLQKTIEMLVEQENVIFVP